MIDKIEIVKTSKCQKLDNNNGIKMFPQKNILDDSDPNSSSVLSFDAYGNLTTNDDPNVLFSHDIPSLDEFDDILQSFESDLKSPKQNGTANGIAHKKYKKVKHDSGSTKVKHDSGHISVKHDSESNKVKHDSGHTRVKHDSGHTRVKHDSGSIEIDELSQEDLKQAFKSEFNCSSVATSRYGRMRKQRMGDDGFLFGTINFNQLRKITNNKSPKKNKSVSDKSNSDSSSSVNDILQNFDILSDKIPNFSSEDEFEPEDKFKTAKKIDNKKLSNKKKPIKSKKNSNKGIKRKFENHETFKKKRPKRNLSDKRELDKNYEVEHINLDIDNYNENFNSKVEVNDPLDIELKHNLDPIPSIEDDINIIKNSICESKNDNLEIKESDKIHKDSRSLLNDVDHNNDIEDENIKIEKPEIIQMETLVDEIKSEEKPISSLTKYGRMIKKPELVDEIKSEEKPISSLTKYGRMIKKPELIDLTIENQKQKEARDKLKDVKQDVSVIEEDFLELSLDEELEKTFPTHYFIGDLVWVILRGSPLWPAIIMKPQDESEYTTIRKSTGTWFKGARFYCVQFLCDNFMIQWARESNLIQFEGLPKLISHLEQMREEFKQKKYVHSGQKLTLECSMKTLSILQKKSLSPKLERWHHAIQEAETLLEIEKYERIDKLIIEEEQLEEKFSTKKKKKRKPIKSDIKNEENMSSCSSSKGSLDEFSGFEDLRTEHKIKDFKNNFLVNAEFELYFQKNVHKLMMKNPNLTQKMARKKLDIRWKRMPPEQKAKFISKFSANEKYFLTLDTDESDSDSSNRASRPRRMEFEDPSRGMYRIVRNEKVCVLCETVSVKAGGADMVKCKGPCCSIFHQNCVGLAEGSSTSEFRCSSCISGVYSCFICKSSEGDAMIKCTVNSCGKFYHENCVKSCPQISKAKHSEKLVCPRHICHMCAANADDMNDLAAKTPPFTRCIRCPTTYHTGELCLAAGAEEISQSHHICTKHLKFTKNNNHHTNVNWCFCCSKGGSLLLCDQCPAAFHAECLNITAPEGGYICEDCENGKFPVYGDIVWVKLGNYRWWPGQVLHSRFIPDNIEKLSHQQGMFCVHFFGSDDYYWVSKGRAFHYQEGDQGSKGNTSKVTEQKFQKALDIALVEYRKLKERRLKQEESRSLKGKLKPAPYVRIDTNRPVGSVKLGKLDPSNVTKCDCDPYSENPCDSDDKCINRMLMVECIREVCPGGDRCNNQRFQKRQYPNVYSFRTSEQRGWGLRTKDFIKQGQFVIEYVGELIDEAEFRRRIEEMQDSKEENYYFLTVETDRMIDAGPKGNLSRFMNHSCQPNCETQKWTVGADTRVGLFAMRDIQPESELTFNYNLECVGSEKKVCHCGAPNCSGFIGAKVQKPESSNGKKDKLKKKKRGLKRKLKEKNTENECFRCGGVGDLILCDMTVCPKAYHLQCLGLPTLPKGKWVCPWHHCDECGSRSFNRCILCPNSFCRSHASGKFHTEQDLENVCTEHEEPEIQHFKSQLKKLKEEKLAEEPPEENEGEQENEIEQDSLVTNSIEVNLVDQGTKGTSKILSTPNEATLPRKRGRKRKVISPIITSPKKSKKKLNSKRQVENNEKRILKLFNHDSARKRSGRTSKRHNKQPEEGTTHSENLIVRPPPESCNEEKTS